jgi:hypothetical protein
MELFKNKNTPLAWEYDGDADTLYISFGKPTTALGVDVGEGVIAYSGPNRPPVPGQTGHPRWG